MSKVWALNLSAIFEASRYQNKPFRQHANKTYEAKFLGRYQLLVII